MRRTWRQQVEAPGPRAERCSEPWAALSWVSPFLGPGASWLYFPLEAGLSSLSKPWFLYSSFPNKTEMVSQGPPSWLKWPHWSTLTFLKCRVLTPGAPENSLNNPLLIPKSWYSRLTEVWPQQTTLTSNPCPSSSTLHSSYFWHTSFSFLPPLMALTTHHKCPPLFLITKPFPSQVTASGPLLPGSIPHSPSSAFPPPSPSWDP